MEENYGTLSMENIAEAMRMSHEKASKIDEKKQELNEETRIEVHDNLKAEIEALEADKQEFDEMTINALVNMKRQILAETKRIEDERIEKLTEFDEKRMKIEQRAKRMKKNAETIEDRDEIDTNAKVGLEKLDNDLNDYNEEYANSKAILDANYKKITEYAIELDALGTLDEVELESKKNDESQEKSNEVANSETEEVQYDEEIEKQVDAIMKELWEKVEKSSLENKRKAEKDVEEREEKLVVEEEPDIKVAVESKPVAKPKLATVQKETVEPKKPTEPNPDSDKTTVLPRIERKIKTPTKADETDDRSDVELPIPIEQCITLPANCDIRRLKTGPFINIMKFIAGHTSEGSRIKTFAENQYRRMIANKVKRAMKKVRKSKEKGKDTVTFRPPHAKENYYTMIDSDKKMDAELLESYFYYDAIEEISKNPSKLKIDQEQNESESRIVRQIEERTSENLDDTQVLSSNPIKDSRRSDRGRHFADNMRIRTENIRPYPSKDSMDKTAVIPTQTEEDKERD